MDNTNNSNFQTSFIPKKALAEERAPVVRHTSILSVVAVIVFIGSIAAAGGAYFYKQSLTKQLADMDSQLAAARNSFEPSLITKLKVLDTRITSAQELLNNHIVVSPIFGVLQDSTLKSVQYTHFSYTTPASLTAPITVTMNGKARDYTSIALESDQLALNKNIHNPIFSNLTLDDRTGTVNFDLVFNVDADLVRFTKHLDEFGVADSTAATPDATLNPTSNVSSN